MGVAANPITERIARQIVPRGDCLIWLGSKNEHGYGVINIPGANRNRRVKLVHRVVFALANGPIPPGAPVLHHCDTPACVALTHLYRGTQADNSRDARVRGRLATGARANKSGLERLSIEDVRLVRQRLASGETAAEVAQAFSVPIRRIWRIRRGATWSGR